MEESKNKDKIVSETEWNAIIKNFGKDSSKRISLTEILAKHKTDIKKAA